MSVTILEAVAQAKREFLQVPGIVGIGYSGNTIIFYVETPEDVAKVPILYLNYSVVAKVTGRVRLL